MSSRIFSLLHPLYRTNSRFIATIVVSGIGFDYAFNKYTKEYFENIMNNGRTFKYLEPKIRAMQALQAAEDEGEDDDDEEEDDDDE